MKGGVYRKSLADFREWQEAVMLGLKAQIACAMFKKLEEPMRSSVTLGATYRDKITGFKGVCTGHCEYLSGCNQALLIPRAGKDGKAPDGVWYDDQYLDRVSAKVITLENERTPGCDMPAPIR